MTSVLADYQKRAAVGRDRFIAAHPHLFIVRVGPQETPVDNNDWADPFAFQTRMPDLDLDDDDASGSSTELGWIIAPVLKRAGGIFVDRIGLGRARNCDVVLRFPAISKLHAQIMLRDPLMILDLSSANGTKLNGQTLAARTPVPIGVGDRLELGGIEVKLLDAGRLYALLTG